MGSKINPGAFDCYANALPDEPMFVLLARDVTAPHVIKKWIELRKALGLDTPEKHADALMVAEDMRQWKIQNHRI